MSHAFPVDPQVIAAVVLCGFPRVEGREDDEADVRRRLGIVGRVHTLAAEHASQHGGQPCPSGTDAALLRFSSASDAVQAALALVAEVEAARDPDSHRHQGLLAVGIDAGPVAVGPDGRVLGVAVARAVRLAIAAESRSEVWVSEVVRSAWTVPAGLGVQGIGRSAKLRLDLPIGVYAVSDYRT